MNKKAAGRLNLTSLREQVYHYLREEMHSGRLMPGSSLNLNEISQELGVSKTPLRDALIQLETEGLVQILPRRGVRVNRLSLRDVKNAYEIVGLLESGVVLDVFDRITAKHIQRLEDLNNRMRQAVMDQDFDGYYQQNLDFHDVYLNLSDNEALRRLLAPIKRRLYDFPRRGYLKEWELRNCDEHDQFIENLRRGENEEAASLLREVHWSFQVQEKYIREFYSLVADQIQAERELQANGSAGD